MTQTRVFGICAVVVMAGWSLTACSSKGSGSSRSASSIETTANSTVDATAGTTGQRLFYADGVGNRYELDEVSRTLVFTPVPTGESSSGTFNGGPSWSQVISQLQYEKLMDAFTNAIAATDEQTSERSKGTGMVEFSSGEKTILKMSSSMRKALEAELQAVGNSGIS